LVPLVQRAPPAKRVKQVRKETRATLEEPVLRVEPAKLAKPARKDMPVLKEFWE
jgi:hypothetical protein